MVDPLLFGRLASTRRARPRRFKVLVNEDTLLPMMFLGLRKLGNICCGHKMFLNKIRNIFCVPDTKFVSRTQSFMSATNVARAGKRGNICVGNNVSLFARAFRLFNAHLDEYLSENDVKSRFRFGRD